MAAVSNNKKHTDDGDAKPFIADDASIPRQPTPTISVRKPSYQGGSGEDDALVTETNWQCAMSLIYWRRPMHTFMVAFCILLSLWQPVRVLTIVCSLVLLLVSFALVARSLQTTSALTARIYHMATNPIRVQPKWVDTVLDALHHSFDKVQHELMFTEWKHGAKIVTGILTITYLSVYVETHVLMIIATIVLFTLPKLYEVYQEPIDRYLAVAHTAVNNLISAGQNMKNSPIAKKSKDLATKKSS